MTEDFNRRDFMKKVAAGAVSAGVGLPLQGAVKPVPPSDKIIVGVIGTGAMGLYNLRDFAKQPEVEIAAIADVYQPNLEKARQATQGKAQTYTDYRRLLDRQDINVVIIGTPDHWHALPMVEACKSGKDVYVEKPICHNVEEGKVMVSAARKYRRVVQVGTQQRSGLHFQKAVKLVQDGFVGKVSFVRTWNYDNRYPEGIGDPADSDPPSGLDWDFWLGPAPKVTFNANRFGVGDRWSTFRYFWDYAGGYMTDWGVHLIDIVQWAMEVDAPRVVTAQGGKFYLQDNADTPDTLQVTYLYENPQFVCVYENRWNNANSMYGKSYGIEFHGTDGTLFLDRGGFEVIPETRRRNGKEAARTASMQMKEANDSHLDHVRNFLDCVKSRRRPVSDIEIGHRSTSACLLGNVALRSQQRIVWETTKQTLDSGSSRGKAQQYLSREYRAPWKLKA